jgi:hypothetical protein
LGILLTFLELNKKKYEMDDKEEEDKGGDDGDVTTHKLLKTLLRKDPQREVRREP